MDRHRDPKYSRGVKKGGGEAASCTNQVLQAPSYRVIFFVMKSQTGLVSKSNSPGDANGCSPVGLQAQYPFLNSNTYILTK